MIVPELSQACSHHVLYQRVANLIAYMFVILFFHLVVYEGPSKKGSNVVPRTCQVVWEQKVVATGATSSNKYPEIQERNDEKGRCCSLKY